MTTLLDHTPAGPRLLRSAAVHLTAAGPALWRVIDRRGRVIGHLQSFVLENRTRYRARRFHATSQAFHDLGDFWSPDDAVDSLRFT